MRGKAYFVMELIWIIGYQTLSIRRSLSVSVGATAPTLQPHLKKIILKELFPIRLAFRKRDYSRTKLPTIKGELLVWLN